MIFHEINREATYLAVSELGQSRHYNRVPLSSAPLCERKSSDCTGMSHSGHNRIPLGALATSYRRLRPSDLAPLE
ncbi:hypothetical protein ACVWXN_000162 [Bradyrhizobium sp. i1.4.4]